MSVLIDFIKDKLGNIIYPITREKAVYDDNNIRLDNKLADLPKQFYSLQGGIEIPENADLNDAVYRVPGMYYCRNLSAVDSVANYPPNSIRHSFIMHVFYGTGDSYPIQQIEFFTGREIYRRHYNNFNESWDAWSKLLSTADIINNDTTGGTDKAFSAEAGKVLGQEIDALDTVVNLSGSLLSNIHASVSVTTVDARKKGNTVHFYILLTLTNTPNNTIIFKVPPLLAYYEIYSLRSTTAPYNIVNDVSVWINSPGDARIYSATPTLSGTYYLNGQFTAN